MSEDPHPLFAAEVIDCMAEGRAPTVRELYSVAERIRRDAGMRPIFDWTATGSGDPELFLLRAAHLALCGTDGSPLLPGRRGDEGRGVR